MNPTTEYKSKMNTVIDNFKKQNLSAEKNSEFIDNRKSKTPKFYKQENPQ